MIHTGLTAIIRQYGYHFPLRVPVYKGRDYYLYALIGDQYMKLTDISKCGYSVTLK